MQAARLDAEADCRAKLRALTRLAIADLRYYGISDAQMAGKNIAELCEMRDRAARTMMGAPKAAA